MGLIKHMCIRVLRGLKFFVRSRPAKFKPTPHPQKFEKSCPLPPRTLPLLARTRPEHHSNPNQSALFRPKLAPVSKLLKTHNASRQV